MPSNSLHYLPIGDSYTIGTSIDPSLNFPNQLVERLSSEGIEIELIGNPAQNGWTSQNALDREIPVLKESKANFSTLLIGANDWVQSVNPISFRENVGTLMDQILENLEEPKQLIIISVPDFSASPVGEEYSFGRDITAGLTRFNLILKEEAEARSLPFVDIFELSQKQKGNPEMFADDGLHPSSQQYKLWTDAIVPEALKRLQ